MTLNARRRPPTGERTPVSERAPLVAEPRAGQAMIRTTETSMAMIAVAVIVRGVESTRHSSFALDSEGDADTKKPAPSPVVP
jgi:hypothetical protein